MSVDGSYLDALQELDRLRTENIALREALRPFATYDLGHYISIDNFRRAAELLATEKGGDDDA